MSEKKRHTILCVDDDPDDLQLLQEAFKAVGSEYRIIEARDGEDALVFLREKKASGDLPCLVILDINMPKVDGKQTLLSIQSDSQLSAIPVVIFSTSSSLMDKMFFTRRKVEFFTKPINFDQFYEVAAKFLNFCKQ